METDENEILNNEETYEVLKIQKSHCEDRIKQVNQFIIGNTILTGVGAIALIFHCVYKGYPLPQFLLSISSLIMVATGIAGLVYSIKSKANININYKEIENQLSNFIIPEEKGKTML